MIGGLVWPPPLAPLAGARGNSILFGNIHRPWLYKAWTCKFRLISLYLVNERSKHVETLPLEVTRAAGDLRALIGRLSRRLRQTSIVGEMTLPQASVLSLLEREGPTPPRILPPTDPTTPPTIRPIPLPLQPLGLV